MKKIILLMAIFGTYPGFTSVIDDFETAVRGWGGWCDAESVRPSFRLSDDAAGGAHSLEFTFPGSARYSGVTKNGVTIPDNAETLEFWLKPVEGAMPGTLLLETVAGAQEECDVFKAALPAAAPGTWNKISVPLEKFTYAYTKGGKSDRKKPLHPDRSRKFDLVLIGYRQAPGVFRIDELSFGKEEKKEEKTSQGSGVNLLPGDSSFETGPGNWIYYRAEQDLEIFRGDGAFGASCLELKGGKEKFSWVCNYLMHDILRNGEDYVFSFYAKAAPGTKLTVSLINLQWEWLAQHKFELTPEWKRYTFPLPSIKKAEKSYFMFDVPGDSGGNVRIDALQLERGTKPTPYRAANSAELYATVNQSGEIVPEGETPQLEIRLLNTREEILETGITVEFPGREPLLYQAALAPGKLHSITVPCDFARRSGYYPAGITVRDRKGEILARQEAPFVVAAHTGPPDDFFGISVNHVSPEARIRVGSTWTRGNAPSWQATESRQGVFPGESRRTVPRENTLVTIIDMAKAPGWAAKKNGLVADPETVRGFARWISQNIGPTAGAFELQNEPDLTLLHGTGASPREAADHLAGLFKVFHPEIKKSGKPLLLNISGEGMPFAREIFKLAADSIDGIASHPYTFPRYLGPQAGYCSSPEAGNVLGQLKEARELLRQYGGNKELWIGELGWGLDYAAPPDSPQAERHAAFLARTFLLARTIPELKRIIWFTGLGCLEGGRYEYGIWRNSNGIRPLPAVAAFACLASIMNNARETELLLDGEVKAVGWKSGTREFLAVWRPKTDSGEPMPVPAGGAVVRNLYGNLHSGDFTPGEKPYYLELPSPETKREILSALERQRPLTVHGFPTDDRTLALSVRNNLSQRWEGKIQGMELSLAPREHREIRIPLSSPLPASGTTVDLAANSGGSLLPIRIEIPPMLDVKPIGAADWKTVPPGELKPQLVLNERNQIFPPDPFIHWTGPDDLSARIFLGWDKRNFYLIAEVTDDRHENPWKDGDIWRGDSLQFAFDAGNDARPGGGYDNNDYEYGAALERDLWCWQAAVGKMTGKAEKLEKIITREGDKTVYRIRIPWSELSPFAPRPGAIAGFNAVVHDRDDGVTNYFAAAAPGLSPYKQPAMFRKIRLLE